MPMCAVKNGDVLKGPYLNLQHTKIDFGTAFTLVFVVRYIRYAHKILKKIRKFFTRMESSYQTPVTDGALTPSLGVPDDKEFP